MDARLLEWAGLPADFDERSLREQWQLLGAIFDAVEEAGLDAYFRESRSEWYLALLEVNAQLVKIADRIGFLGSNPTGDEAAAAARFGQLMMRRRLM